MHATGSISYTPFEISGVNLRKSVRVSLSLPLCVSPLSYAPFTATTLDRPRQACLLMYTLLFREEDGLRFLREGVCSVGVMNVVSQPTFLWWKKHSVGVIDADRQRLLREGITKRLAIPQDFLLVEAFITGSKHFDSRIPEEVCEVAEALLQILHLRDAVGKILIL